MKHRWRIFCLLGLFCGFTLVAAQERSPESIVKDALGREIPFDLLPRDANGEIVSIEKARAVAKTERNIAVRTQMQQFYPPSSRSEEGLWRDATDANGRVFKVPDETHPRYADFVAACDREYERIDRHYQENYGNPYQAFSRAVMEQADPQRVQRIGRYQDNMFSDMDLTFKTPEDLDAFTEVMRRNGLNVEADPNGHGLYFKVKELDWVSWGNRTVENLQTEYDAAVQRNDPAEQQRLGRALDAAMRDREVCATTEGARHELLKRGTADPMGAKLDHIKKYAQSGDIYTKDKVTSKVLQLDVDLPPGARPQVLVACETTSLLRNHAGEVRALRMEHLPEALRKERRAEHEGLCRDAIVDSYRVSALQHYETAERQRHASEQMKEAARILKKTGGHDAFANDLLDRAHQIDAERARVERSNRQTMREIARSDPGLARRLQDVHVEALRNVRSPQEAERLERAMTTPQSEVRAGFEAQAIREPWGPVARDAVQRVADQTSAVFDKIGTLGGYATIADEAMRLEAEGKGSAAQHIAKTVLTDYVQDEAVGRLTHHVPGLDSALEIMDVPSTILTEMEKEMALAETRGTSLWDAKARGIINTIKEKTFIGTVERVLNEEGMDEVDREMATGEYSWGAVALRTAVRASGELTQMNAVLRFGSNLAYDVYDKEKEAREATDRLRQRLRSKTFASDKALAELRFEIIRLQMDPNAAASPAIQAEIERLQKTYESNIDGLVQLGQKMRKEFGTTDPQVTELYDRARLAKGAQKREFLETKLIHLAAARDQMNVETWIEMKKLRDAYREEIEVFKKRTQQLYANRGDSDPVVRQMMAQLRAMRQTSDGLEKVKFDIRDQWQRENDAAAAARQKELDGYATMIREQADRLPRGVAVYDDALIIEIDDLKIRQAKGEVPEDADLVAIAGANVLRDICYRELRKQQEAGEIPADADLLALLDAALEPEFSGGNASAFTGAASPEEVHNNNQPDAVDVGMLEELAAEHERAAVPTEDTGPFSVSLADPVTEVPGYIDEPQVTVNGNIRIQSGTADGKPHGATIRWRNNVLESTEGWLHGFKHGPARTYSNGMLVSEGFWNRSMRHGPFREYTGNGIVSRETWYRDNEQHGWDRQWSASGALEREKLFLDGALRMNREFEEQGTFKRRETIHEADGFVCEKREWDLDSGLLKEEEVFVYPVPEYGEACSRRWLTDAENELYSESHSDKRGKAVGVTELNWRDPKTGQVHHAERRYTNDGFQESQREWADGGGTLLEVNYGNDGREDWLDGRCRLYFSAGEPQAFKIFEEVNYSQGMLHGTYKRHSPQTGKVVLEGAYAQGRPTGTWREYDAQGQLLFERNFSNGTPNGVQAAWVNGVRVCEITLNQGKRVHFREWDSSGNLLWDIKTPPDMIFRGERKIPEPQKQTTYKASRPVESLAFKAGSEWRSFQNGTSQYWEMDTSTGKTYLSLEHERRDGQLHGTLSAYHASGRKAKQEHYSNGKLDGTAQAWMEDGKLRSQLSFQNGRPIGTAKWLDPKSGQYLEATLEDGRVVGWWRDFHPNGKLKRLRFFVAPPAGVGASDPPLLNCDTPPSTDACFGLQIGPTASFNVEGKQSYLGYRILENGLTRSVDEKTYHEWRKANSSLNAPARLPN